MVLPVINTVVIGRLSELPGDARPDVNLNAFDAKEQGVSRQHAKIVRRRELIYISDLGSSNGTYLNGRPITGNYERILRNGDELKSIRSPKESPIKGIIEQLLCNFRPAGSISSICAHWQCPTGSPQKGCRFRCRSSAAAMTKRRPCASAGPISKRPLGTSAGRPVSADD